MRSLICAFVVRMWHKQVFSRRGSYDVRPPQSCLWVPYFSLWKQICLRWLICMQQNQSGVTLTVLQISSLVLHTIFMNMQGAVTRNYLKDSHKTLRCKQSCQNSRTFLWHCFLQAKAWCPRLRFWGGCQHLSSSETGRYWVTSQTHSLQHLSKLFPSGWLFSYY